MDPRLRRLLVPLAAAAAVLVVLAVVWTQVPGGSGGDPGVAGSDPGASPSSVPGSPGGGTTGDPGDGRTDLPDGGLTPAPGPGLPPAPDTQALDGYYPRDDTTLALNYTSGVPECYGKVGEPIIEESAAAVVVTLPKLPPKDNRDVVCIDIALMASVDVTLEAPLGDREVRDGSRKDAVVERADAPYGDGEPAY